MAPKASREFGRVYEKHIGRTGKIGSIQDILKHPGQVTEDVYKKSPGYYAGGAILPKMPKMPSLPATPQASPRPREVDLESVKERERLLMKKRRGYSSTIATRGGLGTARTQKAKVLGE